MGGSTLEQTSDWAKAPFSEKAYCKALDINSTHGENGYSTMERGSIRPTLDVNGIWGGYTHRTRNETEPE